jgi:hypothetical protein
LWTNASWAKIARQTRRLHINIFPGARLGFGKDLHSGLNVVFCIHTETLTLEEPSIGQFEPMAPIVGTNSDAVRSARSNRRRGDGGLYG